MMMVAEMEVDEDAFWRLVFLGLSAFCFLCLSFFLFFFFPFFSA